MRAGGPAAPAPTAFGLPALRPGLMLVLVYETMISIRHFDLFLIMTQGGPGDASFTLSWLIYVETFRSLRFGTGAAMSYVLAMATFLLSWALIRWLGKRVWRKFAFRSRSFQD
jgi:multiple sugar transport system permease protein